MKKQVGTKPGFIINNKHLEFIISALLFLCMSQAVIAGNDLQYWSRYKFNFFNREKVSALVYTEGRIYDRVGEFGLFLFSPRVKYKMFDILDLQMNLAYLMLRNSNNAFINQFRMEPELNPHFRIGDRFTVSIRNRVEFRHIAGKGWNNTRYRGRARISMIFNESGIFKSVFTDSEFFYDFARSKYSDQWTIPLGLNMAITKNTTAQLFYMVQQRGGPGKWIFNHIIGSMITVRL